jgi:hypothetical protein
MTPAQKQALEQLRRCGGEGAINKHGAIVAGGVRLKFLADTWLRLMTTGHVAPCGPMRIKLTGLGRQAAEPEPFKFNRGGGYSDGHVPAHPGAE